MKEGSVYQITFGPSTALWSATSQQVTSCVVSFEGGDDAVKLARIASENLDPVQEVKWLTQVWVSV